MHWKVKIYLKNSGVSNLPQVLKPNLMKAPHKFTKTTENIAHKQQVKRTPAFLQPSFKFHTLVELADSNYIVFEELRTEDTQH